MFLNECKIEESWKEVLKDEFTKDYFLQIATFIKTEKAAGKITSPNQLQYSPQKIISLVPSQTELLSWFGLDEEVIGITKFCVHPQHWYKNKTRVGGTKNLNIELLVDGEMFSWYGSRLLLAPEYFKMLFGNVKFKMKNTNSPFFAFFILNFQLYVCRHLKIVPWLQKKFWIY